MGLVTIVCQAKIPTLASDSLTLFRERARMLALPAKWRSPEPLLAALAAWLPRLLLLGQWLLRKRRGCQSRTRSVSLFSEQDGQATPLQKRSILAPSRLLLYRELLAGVTVVFC